MGKSTSLAKELAEFKETVRFISVATPDLQARALKVKQVLDEHFPNVQVEGLEYLKEKGLA